MKITTSLFSIWISFFWFSCRMDMQPDAGEDLSRVHCASCHAYPEPAMLDRKSWDEQILPRMGYMMGVLPLDSVGADFIEPFAQAEAFKNPNLFRKEPALSMDEWLAIRAYYTKEAPDEPVRTDLPGIDREMTQFKVVFPDHYLSPPGTTCIQWLDKRLYLGDAHTKRLYAFDGELDLVRLASTGGVPVWINQTGSGSLVTDMGAFSPTDAPVGKILFLPEKEGSTASVLIDGLKRPVHTETGDLDGDGRLDLVICEFAKWTGGLNWWKNDGKGNFERRALRNMPGAIRSYIHDLNKDGHPDIVALFGQGDEGIFAYYNDGTGKFTEVRLLRFPPGYGSSYFSLTDYDGDGDQDILYTCGDKADFLPVHKSYQGIRLFRNDGETGFTESFFFPMQGAYGVQMKDFDKDGDQDIAAIAFFPDFQSEEDAGFLYLENQGAFQMKAYSFPEVNKGRWIVMDAGDVDGDGDQDLVLGSLAFEVIPANGLVEQWVRDGIPFVFLENQLDTERE